MAVTLPQAGQDPWDEALNDALTELDDQTLAEIDRATAAEGNLQAAINAVPGAAAIANEVTRATAAELTLTTAVTTEAAARLAADTTNATAIAAETTARTTAVGVNSAAIAQEVTDRATAVTAEASARTTGDATNATAITAEATARASAIMSAVATETSARTAADTVNADAITAETSARTAAVSAATAAAVAKAGSTMTGALVLPGNPSAALEAATKQYVDANAAGLTIHPAVRAATTVNGTLATAYENGDVIDGVTLATGNRILIKDQTAGAENGVYTVNASGAPTRALGEDTTGELGAGSHFLVTSGTVNGGSAWVQTVATPTIGTTALVFAQSSSPTTVTAGTGISVAGNAVSVDTATVVDKTTAQTLTNKTLTAPAINAPTGLAKTDVGLANVDNTSDATKNTATATLTNKTLTSPVVNTPTGIVKGDVGLGNVDNTSNATERAAAATLANKTLTSPVLNTGVSGTAIDIDATMTANSDTRLATQKATKTALNTKVGAASPVFTGVATTPALAVTGITGAVTPTRLVGGTTAGKPTTGTFAVNDVVPSASGTEYICTVAGTFGVGAGPTFVEVGAVLANNALTLAANYTDGQVGALPELAAGEGGTIATTAGITTYTSNNPIRFVRLPPGVNFTAVTAANGPTIGTTNVAVPTLILNVDANTTYHFEAFLDVIANAGNADWKIFWSKPVGATMLWTPRGPSFDSAAMATTDAGMDKTGYRGAIETSVVNYGGADPTPSTNQSVVAMPTGWLAVGGTAGTFSLQMAQKVKHASDLILLAGSFIKVTRVG